MPAEPLVLHRPACRLTLAESSDAADLNLCFLTYFSWAALCTGPNEAFPQARLASTAAPRVGRTFRVAVTSTEPLDTFSYLGPSG